MRRRSRRAVCSSISAKNSIKAKDAFHESVSRHRLACALKGNEIYLLHCGNGDLNQLARLRRGRIDSYHFDPGSLTSLWQILRDCFRFIIGQQADAASAYARE